MIGIVVSAMFVYLISKLPKPNGNAKYIAYLTNVYTKKEYRNKGIGTQMMNYIKSYLMEKKCGTGDGSLSHLFLDKYKRLKI